MAKPYPQELRDRVLAAYARGMKTKQIAITFQVSPAWARRLKQRRNQTGQTQPKPMGGVTIVKIDLERLRQLVAQQPDATIVQLHQRLAANCCVSAVAMALRRLGLSLKKRRCMQPSRTAPMSPRLVASGSKTSPNKKLPGWSSWTRLGLRPT
jgi:transposase